MSEKEKNGNSDTKFKEGNEIGKETRFKPGNRLSTKYKDEYVDSLLMFYRDDSNVFPTIEGFAESIGLAVRTVYYWIENEAKYPRFAEAYAQARAIQKNKLIIGALTRRFDPSFARFIAINYHDLKDKIEQEIKGDAEFRVNINVVD